MTTLGDAEDWKEIKECEIKHGNVTGSVEGYRVYFLCIIVDTDFHPSCVLGNKVTFGDIRKEAVNALLNHDPEHWKGLLEVSIGNGASSDATPYDDNSTIWDTLPEGSIIWITHVRRVGYKVMRAILRGFSREELLRRSKTGERKASVQTHTSLQLKSTDRYVNMRECLVCKGIFPKLNLCSRCKQVAYCSTVCQKADWSEHKLVCR